jgi:phosphate/sulfate permease
MIGVQQMGSTATMKVMGLALMVLGIGLAVWGFQLSDSVGSQITEAVTGADTDKVMTYYITGAISFVVGLFLFARK